MTLRRTSIFVSLVFVALFASVAGTRASKNDPKKDSNVPVSKMLDAAQMQDSIAMSVYTSAGLQASGLSEETFRKAFTGYTRLQQKGSLRKPYLAIVDMAQPSAKKRLYIVDVAQQKLLVHTLVAHGKNSGLHSATSFSNKPESLQSSLGFYVTADTYMGGNGYSMRLLGQEKNFNDNALARAIVMHGAPYVNEQNARMNGRIGRSWGCPAVSMKEHKQIIDLLKGGSCLFVYAPQANYLAQSQMINTTNLL